MADCVGPIPVLETERLILRPFRRDDAEAAHAIYGDPEVMHYSVSGPFGTIETTAAHLDDHIRREAEHGYAFRAIIERRSDRLIGVGGLVPMPPPWQAIEVGYRICRDRWGEGFATEATLVWLNAGFRYFGLDQILAVVEAANVASVRVVEKCGMCAEGEADYKGVAVRKFAAYKRDWNSTVFGRSAE